MTGYRIPNQFRNSGERLVLRSNAFDESDRLRVIRYRHTWPTALLDCKRCHEDSCSRAGQSLPGICPFPGSVLPERWHPAYRPYRVISGAADVYELRVLARPVPYTVATICYASGFTKTARYAGWNSRAGWRVRGWPKQKLPGAFRCAQIERSKSI